MVSYNCALDMSLTPWRSPSPADVAWRRCLGYLLTCVPFHYIVDETSARWARGGQSSRRVQIGRLDRILLLSRTNHPPNRPTHVPAELVPDVYSRGRREE